MIVRFRSNIEGPNSVYVARDFGQFHKRCQEPEVEICCDRVREFVGQSGKASGKIMQSSE